MKRLAALLSLLALTLAALACSNEFTESDTYTPPPDESGSGSGQSEFSFGTEQGELAEVINIIDGDTIDVLIDGAEYRIRYIGVDTPERDEICYDEATQANAALVEGQTVLLIADVENTDRYDRLLRYVYVGDVFVNEVLVRDGWAETLTIRPNDTWAEHFDTLADQARASGLGCYPTGVFDD